VAVYDRWHRDPHPGDQPCKCGRGRAKLYPGAGHEKGDRWQVRWRDPAGRQQKKNFEVRDGKDPNKHADAYDKLIQGQLAARTYVDPRAGEITLQQYAEQWRTNRTHGESTAANLEARLRLHVYEDPDRPDSGRTPRGGVSIGQHPMGLLASRPSLTAAWVAAMPLADGSKRLVIGDVSAISQAAIQDGVIGRDPTKSKSVGKPAGVPSKAQPYTAAELRCIAGKLPGRFAILPELGAGTGMRRMEMCALGADDIVRGQAPKVRVLRQLKVIGGELRFGPVKNRKPHDVPVPPELVELLDAHAGSFPPAAVTLPWHEPGSKLHGQAVSVRLVLSAEGGTPVTRSVVETVWPAAVRAWLRESRRAVGRGRLSAAGYGIHRTRHTFASVQLRDGTDVVRVAAWLGDTVGVVTKTYLHLMPDDRDGEAAGRSATAAFLSACALNVPDQESRPASAQLEAV
jgi:integrase